MDGNVAMPGKPFFEEVSQVPVQLHTVQRPARLSQ